MEKKISKKYTVGNDQQSKNMPKIFQNYQNSVSVVLSIILSFLQKYQIYQITTLPKYTLITNSFASYLASSRCLEVPLRSNSLE